MIGAHQTIGALCFAMAFLANAGTAQSGALRGPKTATAGSTIVVEVGSSAQTLKVGVPPHTVKVYQVPLGQHVEVQLPNVPPGTVIRVWVGSGQSQSVLEVTIQ